MKKKNSICFFGSWKTTYIDKVFLAICNESVLFSANALVSDCAGADSALSADSSMDGQRQPISKIAFFGIEIFLMGS